MLEAVLRFFLPSGFDNSINTTADCLSKSQRNKEKRALCEKDTVASGASIATYREQPYLQGVLRMLVCLAFFLVSVFLFIVPPLSISIAKPIVPPEKHAKSSSFRSIRLASSIQKTRSLFASLCPHTSESDKCACCMTGASSISSFRFSASKRRRLLPWSTGLRSRPHRRLRQPRPLSRNTRDSRSVATARTTLGSIPTRAAIASRGTTGSYGCHDRVAARRAGKGHANGDENEEREGESLMGSETPSPVAE